MSNAFRRYEILLPRQFNDGSPVPSALVTETILDVESHFGAVSSETQIIRGYWQHEGQPHRDELVRIFVDVPDTQENRLFFQEFKEKLKTRFRQIDIWMTTHPVEIL